LCGCVCVCVFFFGIVLGGDQLISHTHKTVRTLDLVGGLDDEPHALRVAINVLQLARGGLDAPHGVAPAGAQHRLFVGWLVGWFVSSVCVCVFAGRISSRIRWLPPSWGDMTGPIIHLLCSILFDFTWSAMSQRWEFSLKMETHWPGRRPRCCRNAATCARACARVCVAVWKRRRTCQDHHQPARPPSLSFLSSPIHSIDWITPFPLLPVVIGILPFVPARCARSAPHRSAWPPACGSGPPPPRPVACVRGCVWCGRERRREFTYIYL
jgi:hypothetical protein